MISPLPTVAVLALKWHSAFSVWRFTSQCSTTSNQPIVWYECLLDTGESLICRIKAYILGPMDSAFFKKIHFSKVSCILPDFRFLHLYPTLDKCNVQCSCRSLNHIYLLFQKKNQNTLFQLSKLLLHFFFFLCWLQRMVCTKWCILLIS